MNKQDLIWFCGHGRQELKRALGLDILHLDEMESCGYSGWCFLDDHYVEMKIDVAYGFGVRGWGYARLGRFGVGFSRCFGYCT
jgi:hypothetical protein